MNFPKREMGKVVRSLYLQGSYRGLHKLTVVHPPTPINAHNLYEITSYPISELSYMFQR